MNEGLIVVDPKIMMGKPVIKGTRITVELILEKLGAGETREQIIQEHPDIPASVQLLRTKDAHKLYEKFGFKIGECMSK